MDLKALETVLDQLFAEAMANRIICMRMWGYFAKLAAEANGEAVKTFAEKQRLESLQSVDLWEFTGHTNPGQLRQRIRTAINIAFDGLIEGAGDKAQLQ